MDYYPLGLAIHPCLAYGMRTPAVVLSIRPVAPAHAMLLLSSRDTLVIPCCCCHPALRNTLIIPRYSCHPKDYEAKLTGSGARFARRILGLLMMAGSE